MDAPTSAEERRSLREHTGATDYTRRVTELVLRIAPAATALAVTDVFDALVRAAGVEQAVLLSFAHEGKQLSSCRLLAACAAEWCQRYLAEGCAQSDPWLAYALHHCEPTLARFTAADARQQYVIDLAVEHGFRSVFIVPVHSGAGHRHSSVLYLGSSQSGYFEDEGIGLLRIVARTLAFEMHDWWLARIRADMLDGVRMTAIDLELLHYERRGWSSKRIAAALQVSKTSIDSRFRRIDIKMGMPNRRTAAQLAVECGLISE